MSYYKTIFARLPQFSIIHYLVLAQPLLQRCKDHKDEKSAFIIQSGLES